jgi:hypothetical protein
MARNASGFARPSLPGGIVSFVFAVLALVSCERTQALPQDATKSGDETLPSSETDEPTNGVDPLDLTRCDAADLVWKSGSKTMYESYPDPGSEECVKFHGCDYVGLFAACDEKKSEKWVMDHNIVAVYPDFGDLMLHDLCLRFAGKTIIATVLDTCADSDCEGCCTNNKGNADQLIDVEKFTALRWGVDDNERIEWADLGPSTGSGCQ